MIGLARELFLLAPRLGDLSVQALPKYLLFELSSDSGMPIIREGTDPITLPLQLDRTSDDRPNHLYDNAKNLLLKQVSFWAQFIDDAKAAGNPDVLEAVRQTSEALAAGRLHVQRLSKTATGMFYRLVCVANGRKAPPDLAEKYGKTKPVPADAIHETAWLVPCYKGVPVATMPEFRTWWQNAHLQILRDVEPGQEPEPDMLTGKMCLPNRTHFKIRDFPAKGSKTPLFSHKEMTYQFDGRKYGNVPMSAETMLAYAEAGSRMVSNNSVYVPMTKDSTALVMLWPTHEGIMHPLIPLMQELLGTFPDDFGVWDRVQALPEDDHTAITVVLVRSAGPSRAVLVGRASLPASALRAHLLQAHEWFPYVKSLRILLGLLKRPDGPSVLPPGYIPDALWALLSGQPLSTGLCKQIQAGNSPHAGAALDWNRKGSTNMIGRRPHTTDITLDTPETPEEEWFTPENDTCRPYLAGRIQAVLQVIRNMYHEQGNKELVKEGTPEITHVDRAIAEAYKMMQKYERTMDKQPGFLAHKRTFNNLLAAIGTEPFGRLTDLDRRQIVIGWADQMERETYLRIMRTTKWRLRKEAQEKTAREKAAKTTGTTNSSEPG